MKLQIDGIDSQVYAREYDKWNFPEIAIALIFF